MDKKNPVDLIEEIVIACAKQRKSITYSGLTTATNGLRPHRYWHDLLMRLSKQSLEKYGVDLATLVVSKVTGIPGNGFYMSLTGEDAFRWKDNPQEYYSIKSKEIFDYFQGSTDEENLFFGDEKIDFLK